MNELAWRSGASVDEGPHSVHGRYRISVQRDFAEIEACWKTFENEADCYAFQHFAWVEIWHRCVGAAEGITPLFVWVEEPRSGPLMLLPLGLRKRRFLSRLVWLGGRLADYLGPVIAKNCEARLTREGFLALWQKIEAALPRFDVLHLERQPAAIGEQRNPFLHLPHARHPSISAYSTALRAPFEDFTCRNRSPKSASTERRKERRLAEQGKLGFVVADPDNFETLLEVNMAEKSRQYRGLGVPDLFTSPGYCEFLRTLSRQERSSGFVRLFALLLDDTPLATHWGLVYRDRFYHLLPAYARTALTRYSPGAFLLRHMVRWAIEHGLRVYDFTIGDEPYKREWSDSELPLYDCVQGRSLRGHLAALAGRAGRTLKRAVKRHPSLAQAGKAMRARLRSPRNPLL